jgi:regulator of cell morphogenesis and NO signaling
MRTIDRDTRVRDIVTDDYRAAAVLEKYGIDFCCGGAKPLGVACQEVGADQDAVLRDLASLARTPAAGPRFDTWSLDFLADYIEANHHTYVRAAIEPLREHTKKIAEVHGARHPELLEIARLFDEVAAELTQHLMKEEQVLFPYIRELAAAARSGRRPAPPPFGTVEHPIRMMELEHDRAGGDLHRIRDLSRNFAVPEDACTTYRTAYRELEAFERDLHEHIHLENNLLFPKAVALEREVVLGHAVGG